MTTGHILPKTSHFNAVVGGKPTGLAGCARSDECPMRAQCLRASPELPYRADMGQPGRCGVFIGITPA